MYRNLHAVYWCNKMNMNTVDFVANYPNCQQVKVEHQKLRGLIHNDSIPIYKWEEQNMDFIMGLPRTH